MTQKYKKIWPILKIINVYFWKTKIGPLFAILLPLGFMLIYYAICNSLTNYRYFYTSLTLFISMSVTPLSILTISSMNLEFKNSVILRKIKTNGIGALGFTTISFSYYFLLNIISVCITLLFYYLLMFKHIEPFQYVDWPSFVYTIFTLIIVSITFGSTLSVFIKNSLNSQIIGFAIIIFSLILSGQLINIYIVPNVEALKYVNFFSPLTYSMNGMNIATLFSNNNNIFDFSQDYIYFEFRGNGSVAAYPVYATWQQVMYVVGPWVWVIGLQSVNLKWFKWVGR